VISPLKKPRKTTQKKIFKNSLDDDFSDFDSMPKIMVPPKHEPDGLIKKQNKKPRKGSWSNLDDDFNSFINDGEQGGSKQTTLNVVDTPKARKAAPIVQQQEPFTPPAVSKSKAALNVLQKTDVSHNSSSAAAPLATKGCNDFTTVVYEAYKLLFAGEMLNGHAPTY